MHPSHDPPTHPCALLTYAEAARRLGLQSARSIRRLVAAGRLRPVYPLPRSPRISAQALDAYIASLAPPADNAGGVGSAVHRGDDTCQNAKPTRTASTGAATRRSGGLALPTETAGALAAALGLATGGKPKRC